MIVRPYEHGDERFVLNARESVSLLDPSWAWSIEHEHQILAVVGCTMFYKGTGHLWAVVSDNIRGHGFSFTKKMKKLIDMTIRHHSLKRIQAFAVSDKDENKRWLSALGMSIESTMKAAIDGHDLDVYARVI